MLIACFDSLLFYELGAYGWTWLEKEQMYGEKIVVSHDRPQQYPEWGGCHHLTPPPFGTLKSWQICWLVS